MASAILLKIEKESPAEKDWTPYSIMVSERQESPVTRNRGSIRCTIVRMSLFVTFFKNITLFFLKFRLLQAEKDHNSNYRIALCYRYRKKDRTAV